MREEAAQRPCPVVGIGASAGGLEALQAFFERMPVDTGMAFVIIQHLDPEHETLMPELLARHTSMPVSLVTEDTPLAANSIFVLPPNATLTIDDCMLRVSRPERMRGRRSPIDGFFRSLAEDQGDDAVGIILSGTGTDGALGLKMIKEHGGLTLVQAPASARYDSMPRAAIVTGMADHVLPVEEIPAKLVEHVRRLTTLRGGDGAEGLRGEVESFLGRISTLLRSKTGHDFSRYKRSTLVRRIRRRITESQGGSVAEYVDSLQQDPREIDQLFRDLLIGVTDFFRDPEAFVALARKVVPKLFDNKGPDGQVRVWVPGCATGEEAYSLAILLREHALTLPEPPHILIFATDIDAQALEAARQGWYPERIAEQVSAERLARFFVRHGNLYQVTKEIREMCLFSSHNFIADPPFSRLDLVSCRNLLIYLESDFQKKLIPLLHYALRSGGFLFLGPSESVAGWPDLFRTVDKRYRIYQCKDVVLRPPVSFPLADRFRFSAPRPPSDRPPADFGEQGVARAFERVLLENYSPACVLVNERGEVLYFSPRTGKYLEPPGGTPTLRILELARQGLRLDLRTALHKAMTSRTAVTHENVAFESDSAVHAIDLTVRPMFELGEDTGLYMIVFEERERRASGTLPAEAADREVPAEAAGVIHRLESELRITKDHLQATLEELESSNEELISSNEELLSINEELQSANEELQTSKEELQSVNEELETINTELKKKIEELDRINSDLVNLVESTRKAQEQRDQLARIVESSQDAILGKTLDGVVTSWNAGAEQMYGYAAREMIGHPIDVLVPPERRSELDPVFAALRRGEQAAPFETVRVRKDGRRLRVLVTMSPVFGSDGQVVGVSAIARDITDREQAENALREAARHKDEFLAMLGHELRNPLAPIRNCLFVLNMPNVNEAQTQRALATLDRQVVHLTRLVDDLLDVSRISQGKILLRKERLDLVELVRSTVEDHRGALTAAGLGLEVELPAEALWVSGDPTRLSQSVGNILHNALKFTDRGGRVRVTVKAEPAGTAVIVVEDTGIGIELDVLGRLFEPFSQAPPGIDRSRGGLGLGLALVRRLIELHGGVVEAMSGGSGQGTEIRLRLPTVEPPAASPAGDEEPAAGEPRRCLIIEDSVDAAESMALLLQLHGHEVAVAHTGQEGLDKARQLRPHVVLCDIGLPGALDGYAVARAFREDPHLRSARLIALTGYGQEEDQRRARDAGFDLHLTKPADLETLQRLLAG
ncbi:MAG TPA: chemotaxis protein CheB [Thermoanaerobaculia bacterium]|nr:chemotaxis protein CheB [Thermoanaerobaculia bacterium]